MKYILIILFFLSSQCLALDAIKFTLSYKWNGTHHEESLVVGIGGKQEPDYLNFDKAADKYVGQVEYKLNTINIITGHDFRIGFDRSYTSFRIGRNRGLISCISYRSIPEDTSRLSFGQTHELDVTQDSEIAAQMTDVYITSSPFKGKKITNMTSNDIVVYSNRIPKGCAKIIISDPIIVDFSKFSPNYVVRSEHDWNKIYSVISTNRYTTTFACMDNIIVYEPKTNQTRKAEGWLIYGKDNQILFGKNNAPLYSTFEMIEEIYVNTEWIFDESSAGYTTAFLNDENVCDGHSTTHIIPYTIATLNNWRYDAGSKSYIIDFTMKMVDSYAYAEYPVVQRCWASDYTTFADAPDTKRATANVTVGSSSSFRFIINSTTGEWTISAL
jgi:hypothetical protein